MRNRLRQRLLAGVAAILGAVVLVGAEAAVRGRTADAASWQLQMGTDGAWCEGCCMGGNHLCCSSSLPCKIYPD